MCQILQCVHAVVKRVHVIITQCLTLVPHYLQLATVICSHATGLACRGTYCFGARLSDFPTIVLKLFPDNVFPLRGADYVLCSGWGGAQCIIKLQPSFGGSYWILVRSVIIDYTSDSGQVD